MDFRDLRITPEYFTELDDIWRQTGVNVLTRAGRFLECLVLYLVTNPQCSVPEVMEQFCVETGCSKKAGYAMVKRVLDGSVIKKGTTPPRAL